MLLGKYINRYYKKYWFFFLLGIVALVLVDFFNLFVPEKLGEMVRLLEELDHNPGSQAILERIGVIALEVLGVGVIMMLGRMAWRFTIFYASGKIEADFRRDMFAKAERLSQSYYRQNKVGTILNWFSSDLETIQEFLGWGTIMLIDAFFLTIFVLVKMFMLNWALTVMSLFPILLIIVWGLLSEKYLSEVWEMRQKANDRIYDFAQESFSGIRVIKAFVKERQQEIAFDRIAEKARHDDVKTARVSNLFERFIELLLGCIFALLMGLGGYIIYCQIQGTPMVFFGNEVFLKTDELVTFIAYFDTLIWPVIALGSVITMRSRSKASLRRVTRFLDEKETVKSPENAVVLPKVNGAITFDHFSFAYEDDPNRPVLQDVSFSIQAGETVGIVGKIGCGKTTLVDCLLRLNNFEKGTLFVDGVDLMEADLESLRRNIGYVPQDNFLFSNTIEHNIAFSLEETDEARVKEAAQFAQVAKDIESFPDGYKTLLGERGTTVSGGQKQRISMARAYLKDAPIMIMDDSVSAVDVATEEAILRNIKELRAGKTTIVIASRISTVSHLDKVLVLRHGKVEAFASPAELLSISPTYQKMHKLQELEREQKGGAL